MKYLEAMKTLKNYRKKTFRKSIIDLTHPLDEEHKKQKYFYQGEDFIIISNDFVDHLYQTESYLCWEKLNNVVCACEYVFSKED